METTKTSESDSTPTGMQNAPSKQFQNLAGVLHVAQPEASNDDIKCANVAPQVQAFSLAAFEDNATVAVPADRVNRHLRNCIKKRKADDRHFFFNVLEAPVNYGARTENSGPQQIAADPSTFNLQALAPGFAFVESPEPPKNPPKSRRLVHNLMLAPSRVVEPAASAGGNGKTGLERKWSNHERKLKGTLAAMRQILLPDEAQASSKNIFDGSPVIYRNAHNIVKTVQADLSNLGKIIESTEVETLTGWRTERKIARELARQSTANDASDDDSESNDLLCQEAMAGPSLPDLGEETRRRAVLAAQEAALMRETARIIRRKARELALRRAIKGVKKTGENGTR